MAETPNPGSPEARAIGCRCPVLDNGHGAGMPGRYGPLFWVSPECGVHHLPGTPPDATGSPQSATEA
jgi:hypothetical protein